MEEKPEIVLKQHKRCTDVCTIEGLTSAKHLIFCSADDKNTIALGIFEADFSGMRMRRSKMLPRCQLNFNGKRN